jgi:glycosyltransferase involved in cell wall biosynthesis
MEMLYIAEGGITNSVFDSQVFHLLCAIKRKGINVKPALLEDYSQRKNKKLTERFPEVQAEFPDCIDMISLPGIGRLSLYTDGLRLRKLITGGWKGKLDDRVVHARGHFGSFIASRFFSSSRIISDLRGLLAPEVMYYSGGGLRALTKEFRISEILKIEKYIFKHSDRFFCVSSKLKEYIVGHSDVLPGKITVIPTVVDTDFFYFDAGKREEMRNLLGVKNRFVLIYCGGLARWQVPDKIIDLFRNLKKSIPDAFLVFLTNNAEEARVYFKDMEQTDFLIAEARYKEVPSYLNASDAGILIREENPVNRVASPTKFGEYLCCGLPVIITKGIGDTENIVSDFKAGIVMEDPDSVPEVNSVRSLMKTDRHIVSRAAAHIFSIKDNVDKIISVYRDV